MTIFLLCLLFVLSQAQAQPPRAVPVDVVRLPAPGVQPELTLDESGRVHLVYLAGDPAAADVFYAASADGGRTFSRPIRVNSEPGSAVMLGTVRGAQVAVGRDLRAHVAWNAARGGRMLYARSDDDRTAFEPQRNLVTRSHNLDGGGSIATDRRGGVYVAWHGNAPGDDREESRRVWISRSVDDGATFAAEIAVSDAATGACACCALRIFAEPGGYLRLLYRSAAGAIHRDIYALLSRDRGRTFEAERLHPWDVATCPMTSMSFAGGPPTVQAWETDGQVFFNRVGTEEPIVSPPPAAGGAPMRRKHPRVAVNSDGLIMLTWAEGTGWSRGGSLGWQAFAPDGRALAAKGTHDGLPAWSFPAVVARRDGGFTVVY